MILVVDHDPEALEKTREILKGRVVLAASTAQSALAMVRRFSFSVALVDLELESDVVGLIRGLYDASPDLPIIVVSKYNANPKAAAADAWRSLGVVELLTKPIAPAWKPVVERVRANRVRE